MVCARCRWGIDQTAHWPPASLSLSHTHTRIHANTCLLSTRMTMNMDVAVHHSLKLKEMYQMITLGGDAELELVDTLDPFSEVCTAEDGRLACVRACVLACLHSDHAGALLAVTRTCARLHTLRFATSKHAHTCKHAHTHTHTRAAGHRVQRAPAQKVVEAHRQPVGRREDAVEVCEGWCAGCWRVLRLPGRCAWTLCAPAKTAADALSVLALPLAAVAPCTHTQLVPRVCAAPLQAHATVRHGRDRRGTRLQERVHRCVLAGAACWVDACAGAPGVRMRAVCRAPRRPRTP
jgi:hypothetical protein